MKDILQKYRGEEDTNESEKPYPVDTQVKLRKSKIIMRVIKFEYEPERRRYKYYLKMLIEDNPQLDSYSGFVVPIWTNQTKITFFKNAEIS